MRQLFILLCLTFASLTQINTTLNLEGKVGKVPVLESERKLLLLNKGNALGSYRVSLSKRPIGPKLAEGDNRTPEGLYWIDWRKTSNNYNLSMHTFYPNARDVAKAWEKGLPTGGIIMIHDTPPDGEYPEWYFSTLDWINDCIAMNNTSVHEVWSVAKDGTLVEICPRRNQTDTTRQPSAMPETPPRDFPAALSFIRQTLTSLTQAESIDGTAG